jgi:hypothetical protein
LIDGPAQLAPLDSLTRKLLENRSDVICREIEQVLPRTSKPGSALELLNAQNPWSIFVSPPTRIPASTLSKTSSKASAEEIAQNYLIQIWKTLHKRARLANPRRNRQTRQQPVAPAPTVRTSTPWMFAPKTIVMPLGMQ